MIHAVALWRIGKFDEARQAFDQARDAARIAKAPLQAAVVDSNRARFEEDLGRLELAARIAVGAVATSVAFGDRQQEAMQLVNLANLWFDLGRFSECKSAIQRSREIAHAMRQPGLLRRLDLIQAHVALNEGDFAAAHAALDRSVNQARELSDEPSVWRAELVRTEVLMRQGRGRAARRLLDQAAAALDGAGHSDEKALAAEYRLQWATFAGSPALVARLAAAVELPPGSRRRRAFLRDAQLSALHRLARKADLARIAREQIADLEGAELVALSARAHAALALAERGAAGSDERIAAARQAYARVKAPGHLALKAEAALMLGRAARDVRLLEEAEEFARRAGHLPLAKRARELRRRVAPARAGDVDGATRLASLERLMRVAKRITAAPDGEELLRLLLDDAVEATRAARGFLILARGGELAVRCARNLDAADIERPELSFSSTVARSVAADGKSVLFADVSTDERWRDAASISQLKLLSVLCAPIGGQGRIIGSVYLDEPTRIDAFRPGDLRYVESLADFAAIALEKIELLDQDRAQKRQLLDSQQEIARLNTRLQQALLAQREELHSVRASLERARAATGDAPQFAGIVSHGAAMDEVRRRIERVARSTLPVLVTGESGTGKELVARAIHGAGTRAARPFEAFNCSTTPNGLIENELFGHRKGAFTGADVDQPGLFEHCDGGTLFLDEVAEAPAELQAKLLRVVQDGIVQRLGGGAAVHVDVRLIAATNRDLKAQVAAGRFREDLLYRLNVLPINLLPLRERREDIPLLLEHFARREAAKLGIPPPRFTPVAWRCLMRHDWPGNVRELEHAIQRLFVLHRDVEEIGVEALRSELPAAVADEPLQTADLRGYLDRQEEQFITEVLARCGGNRSKAAKELGISERNLYQRLQRFRGADHPKP
jgi:transcriptional regulator with GAF, ATPase, and Fis domain